MLFVADHGGGAGKISAAIDRRSAGENVGTDSTNVGRTRATPATLFLAGRANIKVR